MSAKVRPDNNTPSCSILGKKISIVKFRDLGSDLESLGNRIQNYDFFKSNISY